MHFIDSTCSLFIMFCMWLYVPAHVSFEGSQRKHLIQSMHLPATDNFAIHGTIVNVKACIIECVEATCFVNCKKVNDVMITICKKLNGVTLQQYSCSLNPS